MATPHIHEASSDQKLLYIDAGTSDVPFRRLSRSPRPYHRRGPNLPSSDAGSAENGESYNPTPIWIRSPRSSSGSGTEADDESTGWLKGLPAPPVRSRKGIRDPLGDGANWDSGLKGDRPWSAFRRLRSTSPRKDSNEVTDNEIERRRQLTKRRRTEGLWRLSETISLLVVGGTVYIGNNVRFVAQSWNRELLTFLVLVLGLYTVYPLRICLHTCRRLSWRTLSSFSIFPGFDPAPLLYPILLPVLVALSLIQNSQSFILPNIMLSLSSLPPSVIPSYSIFHGHSLVHWVVTVIPLIVSEQSFRDNDPLKSQVLRKPDSEVLLLIFPLHEALMPTLDFLVSTSLLPAELQLLATGLINLVLFSASPHATILKCLLWLGGINVFILCKHALHWEVTLARIPSWKFRRSLGRSTRRNNFFRTLDDRLCQKIGRANLVEDQSSEDDTPKKPFAVRKHQGNRDYVKAMTQETLGCQIDAGVFPIATAVDKLGFADLFHADDTVSKHFDLMQRRRHTFPIYTDAPATVQTTGSGRRKRLMTPRLRSFLTLTVAQAHVRKWAYALYVYLAILLIILFPVRRCISEDLLQGNEPFGWALGYLFGNISSFRFWLVKTNLEKWVPIPALIDRETTYTCHLGWVERLRRDPFGEANTRLIISGYCLLVLFVGMATVFRLSVVVEVDTRRKVFHGMMVAMFLPTIFIDPIFAALAMALILTIFLVLDLFRASQLPPISKPLTYFLTPYVDGRDHRGPVIVSHIFLLIGCAVPLWLSLAGLPRTGVAPWEGWGVETRDASMVSGVICVGMGDAAASLVGRRYGRRKWFWGGGKSLEGSVAFAVAVLAGLLSARIWLVVGGWDTSVSTLSSFGVVTITNSVLAAASSSFTEAVLTGANDNVVVPLILWLLVRGLGV